MTQYGKLIEEINQFNAQLIAVSKNRSVEEIMLLYQRGQKKFAENRPQEFLSKFEFLPTDIEWHLIGHLQTNKVRSIIKHIHLIHSADSLNLLETINHEAHRSAKNQKVLLQIKISKEETKHGFNYENLCSLLDDNKIQSLANLSVVGIMGIGSLTDDPGKTRNEFKLLKSYFEFLKSKFFSESFKEISMGMSSDYRIALEEGATMVRIGSILF